MYVHNRDLFLVLFFSNLSPVLILCQAAMEFIFGINSTCSFLEDESQCRELHS